MITVYIYNGAICFSSDLLRWCKDDYIRDSIASYCGHSITMCSLEHCMNHLLSWSSEINFNGFVEGLSIDSFDNQWVLEGVNF